ncbi:unnamed protein product [Rotaria sp. Silwood2]|nr:unnamed protein product [Rotaria sp. Silwood2]
MNGTQQIGYIRPIWLDKPTEVLPTRNEWLTCIRLPIKQDKQGDGLQRNFDDIQPILLLFLNRLRQIEIIHENNNRLVSICSQFTRIDHAQGQIIELQERTTQTATVMKQFWLVMKLSEVKCDVESTTIAIAYPLNPIDQCSSHQILSTQPLFAYLPLRSYGFRFILQADFEITASRQEILRDNRWNDWLKSEMIQLFPLTYERFQHLPTLLAQCKFDFHQTPTNPLTKIQTLKYFLKLIPTRNEIDPYFNIFVDKSIQCLMGIIRLPVFCHDDDDDDDEQHIDWVLPSQCVLIQCDEQILIKLGCHRLDFGDILKLIRTLYKQNDQVHSTKTTNIEQIAQWLLCIDYSLQQERERPGFNNDDDNDENEMTTMNELKQLKIIPLRHQSRLVSFDEFEERTILFPLDKSIKFEKHLKIILDDLPTIDNRLLDYIEDKYPRRIDSVKTLLTNLGLCDARNIRRIYSSHILPVINDDSQWSKKSNAILIAYLICIYKELYAPNPETFTYEMEKLKTKMIIKTRDGKFVRLDIDKTIIHLTSLYGCSKSLEYLKLSNHQFTFISNDYIQQYQNELFYHDREKQKFVIFLNELNLYDFFQMKYIDKGFINVEKLVDSPWANEISSISELIHEPFIIKDWYSDEFERLISSKDNDIQQCIQLLLYLHQHHKSIAMYYVASVICTRTRYMNMPPIKGVESSFLRLLRQHSWIPVVGGKLFKPTDVYCLKSNHQFHRYVPHVDLVKVPLKDVDFMFNILGLRKEITSMTMFELFMKWSCNLDRDSLYHIINFHVNLPENETIPCTMLRTTRQSCLDKIENICQVYQTIISNNQTHRLLLRFRLWSIVFVPRTGNLGDFLYVDEVIWHDPHSLLDITNNTTLTSRNSSMQYTFIRPYYGQNPTLSSFFIDLLHVKQQPTLEDYLPLLSNVINRKKEYIWRCIDVITRLAFAQNKQTLVRDKCANWAFIPSFRTKSQFCKYNEPIFCPHDLDIARLFIDALLIINPSNKVCTPAFKNMFCSMFKIRNLGDIIKIVAHGDNEYPSVELTDFYSHTIDLIQSFLIKNNGLIETRSNYFQSVFVRMKIVYVHRIHFSYSYNENIIRTLISSTIHSSYIDESEGKFFILKIIDKPEKHINTMVNYLVDNELMRPKLAEFIKNLYQSYQHNGDEGLINFRKSLPSSADTSKWMIPSIFKQPNQSLLEQENDDELQRSINNASVNIANEAIENMKNESSCFSLNIQHNKADTDGSKPLVSFPVKPGTLGLHLPLNGASHERKSQSGSITQEKLSESHDDKVHSSISTAMPKNSHGKNENDQDEKKDKDVEQNLKTNNNEHIEQKKTTDDKKSRQNNSINSKNNAQKQSSERERSFDRTLTIRNISSSIFECIRVSNIRDFDISVSNVLATLNNPSSSNSEDDLKTGRSGECFVFRYLQWKYPDEQIEWMNQHQESGRPYDIRLVHKENNKETELIEVKTTRSCNKNTFQVSISEIECLLENPNNYSIYRVYYNDDEKSSTITILNQVKVHLQKKDLVLSMSIMAKSSET